MDLLLKNIAQLATPVGKSAKKGQAQREVTILENAMLGIQDGKIAYVGPEDASLSGNRVIDCSGKLVTPGLVDAHTHLVFGGYRQNELAKKLAGVPYLDILREGGGILSTVRSTRSASEEELYEKTYNFLDEMLRYGATTVEAKSGYGLDMETERKQLNVMNRLKKEHPVDLALTFMGAHAFPDEYKNDHEGYIKLLCEEMIPAVAKENLAEFCDIFCENAVFNPEQSKQILETAKAHGLKCKAHCDEIDPIGGAEMAAEVGCISAEHLIQASDQGIEDLGKAGVVAVLLPATSFYLEKDFARARRMIDNNVAVAVATDFNPGSSPNCNIQIPLLLATLKYKLTPAEALTAITLNGAAAIDRADTVGSLEVGKQADVLIWDAPDLNFIFYRYGSNLVETVIKKGNIIGK